MDHTFKRMLEMPLTAWPDPLFYDEAWRFHRTLSIFLQACEDGGGPEERDWVGLPEWGESYARADREFDRSLCGYIERLDAERDGLLARFGRMAASKKRFREIRRKLKKQSQAHQNTNLPGRATDNEAEK